MCLFRRNARLQKEVIDSLFINNTITVGTYICWFNTFIIEIPEFILLKCLPTFRVSIGDKFYTGLKLTRPVVDHFQDCCKDWSLNL